MEEVATYDFFPFREAGCQAAEFLEDEAVCRFAAGGHDIVLTPKEKSVYMEPNCYSERCQSATISSESYCVPSFPPPVCYSYGKSYEGKTTAEKYVSCHDF